MRRRRPRSEDIMQGVDEWQGGFGKIFREFIEEIQQNAFERGLKVRFGRFSKKAISNRYYNSNKNIRQALLFTANAACKQFEQDHDVKIPKKGSLTKRIAAHMQQTFERYENFIIEEAIKNGEITNVKANR